MDYFDNFLEASRKAAQLETVIKIAIERWEEDDVEYTIEYLKKILETE